MSELARRRELERLSKPDLITKVIECERAPAATRQEVPPLDVIPPVWRCSHCPLIIVGEQPDHIARHEAEHQESAP